MSLFYYINLVKHKKILLSKIVGMSYNLEWKEYKTIILTCMHGAFLFVNLRAWLHGAFQILAAANCNCQGRQINHYWAESMIAPGTGQFSWWMCKCKTPCWIVICEPYAVMPFLSSFRDNLTLVFWLLLYRWNVHSELKIDWGFLKLSEETECFSFSFLYGLEQGNAVSVFIFCFQDESEGIHWSWSMNAST